jgi:hypothetical protein
MGELTCQKFADLVGDYVERRLKAEQALAMDGHRLACQECRDLLTDYRRIPEILRRATDVKLPAGAQARLRRLLAHAWRRRI